MKGTNKQKGVSLIEMMFVIGLTSIIASITFFETRHSVETERAQQAIADMRTIYLGSVSYYDSYGSYSTVTMNKLCITDSYVDSSICGTNGTRGTGTGPWNGNYVVQMGGAADPTQIKITLSQVPRTYGGYIMRELLTDVTINSSTTYTSYDITSGTKIMTATYYRSV